MKKGIDQEARGCFRRSRQTIGDLQLRCVNFPPKLTGICNLLILHSTKGLEFSRVYIIGVEDSQFARETQSREEIEEARRLLYVGMTRTIDRVVLTRVVRREGEPTGGYRFLEEMGLVPRPPEERGLP